MLLSKISTHRFFSSLVQAHITAERLRLIWLFTSAPWRSLQQMEERFMTLKLRRDDQVTLKGAEASSMFIVVNGRCYHHMSTNK